MDPIDTNKNHNVEEIRFVEAKKAVDSTNNASETPNCAEKAVSINDSEKTETEKDAKELKEASLIKETYKVNISYTEERIKKVNQYTIRRTIGRGRHGKVVQAEDSESHKRFV